MLLSSQGPHPQPGSGSALCDRPAFIQVQQSNNRRLSVKGQTKFELFKIFESG